MKKISYLTLVLLVALFGFKTVSASENTPDYVMFSNVDSPYFIEDILENIISEDETDGDITSSVIIFQDEYTGNERTLGEYLVQFKSIDSDLNESVLTIEIRVVDIQKPLFSGFESKEIPLNMDEYNFLEGISASDNYDGNITADIEVDSSSVDFSTHGEYDVIYTITDSSGNINTKTLTYTVKDMVYPVFEGVNKIVKRPESVVLKSDIESTFEVYDNLDGSLYSEIYIIEDYYTGFGDVEGEYYIEYGVKDSSGNETVKKVTIIVTTEIPKETTYIDDKTINVPVDYKLTDEDILSFIKYSQEIDKTKAYAITYTVNEYDENYNVPSKYNMTVKVVSNSGIYYTKELEINVLPDFEYEFIESDETSFFESINPLNLPPYISIPLGLGFIGVVMYMGTKKK